MKGKGLLFGLNYDHIPEAKLNGCINDVNIIAKKIDRLFGGSLELEVFTDDHDKANTSYDGIIRNLYNLAIDSYSNDLDFVWVHFSGHGSQARDTSGDELDYMDEGICPSDFHLKGIVIDDILNHVISRFNPKTKLLFICDSCHSGSILDLRYSWKTDSRQAIIDNKSCKIRSNVILISGCMDNQTSADAYNLLNDQKHIGALTACIVKTLESKPQLLYDAFAFVNVLRKELQIGGFNQYPCLSSTYDLTKNSSMIYIPSVKRDIEVDVQQPVQQPVMQQPVQQPVMQQPVMQQPIMQQPVMQQPVMQQPVMQQASHYVQQPVPQYSSKPMMQQPHRPVYIESQNTYFYPIQIVTVLPMPIYI